MHYVLTILLVTFTLILDVSAVLAQRAKKAKTPKQSERHMLWRVESDSTVVYVMGSVHMLPKNYHPLDTILERSLDSADVLVLEVKLDETAQLALAQRMMTDAVLEEGKTLEDVVDAKTYALAATRMKKHGLDIALFERFEPWVVALTLTGMDLRSTGFSGELGVDAHFSARAAAESKALEGLESVEDQLDLFDAMSPATQAELLRQTLEGNDATSASLVKLAHAWRNGDVKALERLALDEMRKDSAFYHAMLVDRNRAWLPKIERYLNDASRRTLVVVGAAHLLGPDGVIAMLRERGYDPVQL